MANSAKVTKGSLKKKQKQTSKNKTTTTKNLIVEGRYRVRETESSYPLVHSASTCNSRTGGAEPRS